MRTGSSREPTATDTIAEPIDEEGACTRHQPTTGTSYHVVDYADRIVREKLDARPAGTAVRLDLSPADPDGLDWIVTRIAPGSPVAGGPMTVHPPRSGPRVASVVRAGKPPPPDGAAGVTGGERRPPPSRTSVRLVRERSR